MSFRTKLLAFFTLSIVAAVTLVAYGVSVYTRRAFEDFDRQRTEVLEAQFRREYAQRGEELARRVQGIADAEAMLRMAMDLNRPQADASQYYNDARGIAQTQQLDFLDIVADDGALISSAEWPARFGYKNDWVSSGTDWNSQGAFLRRVDMPDTVELGLLAVRSVRVGEKHFYLIGGQRLDQKFLATLVLPENMRALLYRNLEPGFTSSALTDQNGPVAQADVFAPLIAEVQRTRRELQRRLDWTSDRATNSANFDAIPLTGRENDLLGVLLVGSSRQDLIQMLNFIRNLALLVGGGVILLGLILGWWISARVTRPIEQLAAGAREVAAGRWNARVEVRSRDEIGQLAAAFNEMTRQLAEQRERLVQTERVAAWRELARRLAHELKNPLFPLQLTVENLQRAREQTPEQFDEVFFESTATMRAELENLKAIVTRFSDFAKMPPPEFEPVDVNESVRSVVKLFEPQLATVGRPPITPELYLDENLARPQADPILLRRALENLVLNSLDAMPAGGTLTVRTLQHNGSVRLEVSDTGAGLTPEECARLFTPYYTSKRHGTGLGLAIVQSVVSDHSGKIEVESAPGAGATFRIDLPIHQQALHQQGLHPEATRQQDPPPEDNRTEARPAEPPIITAA
jgi:nitrogen fixation/metabolism regulation signal transduction histidine kinase